MKKLIIVFIVLMPFGIFAQNWTPEEQLILERVKTGWSAWQDAVNKKDFSIWLEVANPTDDWQAWLAEDGGLWSLEDTEKNFNLLTKDVVKYFWINVNPLSIKVFNDVAFIWFYALYAEEYENGSTDTFEQKRFEVYQRVDGKWRWSAGMIVTNTI